MKQPGRPESGPRTRIGVALAATALVAGVAGLGSALEDSPTAPRTSVPDETSATSPRAPLPITFVQNVGQLDPAIGYALQGGDTGVAFTTTGVLFTVTGTPPQAPADATARHVVAADFVGAAPTTPVGVHRTSGIASYFSGPESTWHTGAPMFDRISYPDLWPGIDLAFWVSGPGEIEYAYHVHPGADPDLIALSYRGASSVEAAGDGTLRILTPLGTLVDARPVSYQGSEGNRVDIASVYEARPSATGAPTFGFALEDYDPSRMLVIDPAYFVSSGYIGGAAEDQAFRVVVDEQGYEYVVGIAGSDELTFPVTVGPDLTYNGDTQDAFVGKLLPDGAGYVYLGYIGGAGTRESGLAVAIDSLGAAFVTGTTGSNEESFPVTVGPDLTYGGGRYDAFIAKVSPDGTTLEFCGYIGGRKLDVGMRIAVDSSGAAHIGGYTGSDESTLPVVGGPDLTYNGGSYDGVVAKVTPDGTSFVYLGYIGGEQVDVIRGIDLGPAGEVYTTGLTGSDESTFPVVVGPDLTYNGGRFDGFVTEVSASGESLVFSGYVGGAEADEPRWIIVGPDGSLFITGNTGSDETTFPVAFGPDLTYNGGMKDAFVARMTPDGLGFIYCGYIGGRLQDWGRSLDVASDGTLHVAGMTASNENSFPVKDGPDMTYGGARDGFLASVSPDGSELILGTYIGGASRDFATGVAVDASGRVYVTGTTASDEETFPVLGGPDPTYNGGVDGFLTVIATTEEPPP